MSMSSPKSYLLRAFYEWILDNSMTPYVLVDASAQGVEVPSEYVEDGKIILGEKNKIEDSRCAVNIQSNCLLVGSRKNGHFGIYSAREAFHCNEFS